MLCPSANFNLIDIPFVFVVIFHIWFATSSSVAHLNGIKIHALRHSHASLLISMGENPLIIKDRLGHEKIQTTLGTYGHLYPNSNFEVAKKLTGMLSYTPATHSIADYTSNQFTAEYHREVI